MTPILSHFWIQKYLTFGQVRKLYQNKIIIKLIFQKNIRRLINKTAVDELLEVFEAVNIMFHLSRIIVDYVGSFEYCIV